MAKKNRVKLQNNVNKNVKNDIVPASEDSINFNFTYQNWLKCIKYKDFTNMCKDVESFANDTVHIFSLLIPYVQKYWEEIRKKGSKKYPHEHCHLIVDDKAEMVKEIVSEIHPNDLSQAFDNFNIWQFGVTGGIRLIGILNHHSSTYYPLFIDRHHLIYPNDHYNQPDYDTFRFCPLECFAKSTSPV